MQMIVKLVGTPSQRLIDSVTDKDAKKFMQALPKKKAANLKDVLKCEDQSAVDLITQMLKFDPSQRITVEQALEHPFLECWHDPNDEPTGDKVSQFDFDFELYNLKIDEYKELIYQEIQLYHSEALVQAYMKNKKEHPNGLLFKVFDNTRLRDMYKEEAKTTKK